VLNPLDTRVNRFGRWSGSMVSGAGSSSPEGQIGAGVGVLEIVAVNEHEPAGLSGAGASDSYA
jgi:hypothetical protein